MGIVDLKCRVCESKMRNRRCGRCRGVRYCSQTCQMADWTIGGHRETCIPLHVVHSSWTCVLSSTAPSSCHAVRLSILQSMVAQRPWSPVWKHLMSMVAEYAAPILYVRRVPARFDEDEHEGWQWFGECSYGMVFARHGIHVYPLPSRSRWHAGNDRDSNYLDWMQVGTGAYEFRTRAPQAGRHGEDESDPELSSETCPAVMELPHDWTAVRRVLDLHSVNLTSRLILNGQAGRPTFVMNDRTLKTIDWKDRFVNGNAVTTNRAWVDYADYLRADCHAPTVVCDRLTDVYIRQHQTTRPHGVIQWFTSGCFHRRPIHAQLRAWFFSDRERQMLDSELARIEAVSRVLPSLYF